MRPSLRACLAFAEDVALEAGGTLRDELARPGGPRGRGSHADVDAEVEAVIRQRLLAFFPCGFLGEETGTKRSRSPCTWVIDPNDGTESYLRGLRGPAVSIGLLRHGVPVLGVVYSYRAPDDEGTLFAWAEGCGSVTVNGHSAAILRTSLEPAYGVAVSQDARSSYRANETLSAPSHFQPYPSIAYRLALTAAGKCSAGCSLGGVRSWDVAAGHALLRGAGGTLVDGYGREVTYWRTGELVVPVSACFGGAATTVQILASRDWRACLLPLLRSARSRKF